MKNSQMGQEKLQGICDAINKDILVLKKKEKSFQEKLQGICDAIDKDQLIAETKAKDILVLEKKEKSLKESITLLKQLESDSKMTLSATQEKNEAVMVEMASRKAKLQAEIDKQIQKIDDVGIIMINEETKHNKQIKKLASEYSTAIDEFNKKKEELGQ